MKYVLRQYMEFPRHYSHTSNHVFFETGWKYMVNCGPSTSAWSGDPSDAMIFDSWDEAAKMRLQHGMRYLPQEMRNLKDGGVEIHAWTDKEHFQVLLTGKEVYE